MAVYGQPKMLAKQIEVIQAYPPEILGRLTVIVVDDCGEPPAVTPETWKLFRITQDIPWNQGGARNLGMKHAQGWCVMLDPDMIVDVGIACRFMDAIKTLERGQVVRFGLKHMNGSRKDIDMSSPNTYLIHRDDFWRVGGYDEDYAGGKGWSDVQLLQVLADHFKMRGRNDLWVEFYDTDAFSDAQVMTLNRSVRRNKKIHLCKRAEAKVRGWVRWVKVRKPKLKILRFPWIQVH